MYYHIAKKIFLKKIFSQKIYKIYKKQFKILFYFLKEEKNCVKLFSFFNLHNKISFLNYKSRNNANMCYHLKRKGDILMHFAFNYKLNVQHLPVRGRYFSFEATNEECLLLAKNHDLISVESFKAQYHLFPWKADSIKMKGHFEAKIVQKCVVSLLPIEETINEKLDIIFAPDGSKLLKNNFDSINPCEELFLDIDGPDVPEMYTKHTVDIGAITEEMFELSLNPYPRYEGVDFLYSDEKKHEKNGTPMKDSPFYILKNLKKNKIRKL